MGEVYRDLDARVGRQVALEILSESLASNEERRRRSKQSSTGRRAEPSKLHSHLRCRVLPAFDLHGTIKVLDSGVARMQAGPGCICSPAGTLRHGQFASIMDVPQSSAGQANGDA